MSLLARRVPEQITIAQCPRGDVGVVLATSYSQVKLRRTVVREEAGSKTNRKDTERLTDRLIGLKDLLNWCVPTDPKFYIAAAVVTGKEPQARKAVSSVLPLVIIAALWFLRCLVQATAILPDNLNDNDVGCLVKDWR